MRARRVADAAAKLCLAAAIIAGDRVFKAWCAANLERGVFYPFLPGFVRLVYVENQGAAFSMLEGMRWILVVVSAAAVCLIAYLLVRRWPRHPLGEWSLVAVSAGALGNLIDRALSGYVVDMFEFEFVRFAIFNVADIFITCGGAVFLLYLLLLHEKAGARG
jgi:signal peptidase II